MVIISTTKRPAEVVCKTSLVNNQMPPLYITDIIACFPTLPEPLDGLRLVHLTDMHIRGYGVTERRVRSVLESGGDMVLCTGDSCWQTRIGNPLVDTPAFEAGRQSGFSREGLTFAPRTAIALMVWRHLLDRLSFPLGVYVISGNHDSPEFLDELPSLGVHVLRNETVALSEHLQLCGLHGASRIGYDIPAALERADPNRFTIGLTHFPETAPALAAAGVNLILTGHTHGGQICLPGGRPLTTHSRCGRDYLAGLAHTGESLVYTSRGVGYSLLPLRINCPAEIVRITLRRDRQENTRLVQKKLP
ncbi:MAG: metallophosphoesterase [Sedimentisphaerales bacterium]|nr:metallophosphoesterase [Sedimentisphaerales bacterium]